MMTVVSIVLGAALALFGLGLLIGFLLGLSMKDDEDDG